MSERRLRNFTVPDNSIDSLSQSDNIMLKRTVINRTNATQKQTVSFSVEKSDSVEVLISSSYMSSECNDQKKSFSNNFGTKLSTEMTVETSFWVASAKAKVGADITSGFESAEETAKHACDETTKGNGETKSTKKTTTLSFVDEIAIPPMTSTVITGKSTPYKGTLPYTISYELYPRGNRTLDTIMKGLEHFKMADKVTKLSDGAIIVEFEGRIKIDTGYDVFVDIAPTPL